MVNRIEVSAAADIFPLDSEIRHEFINKGKEQCRETGRHDNITACAMRVASPIEALNIPVKLLKTALTTSETSSRKPMARTIAKDRNRWRTKPQIP